MKAIWLVILIPLASFSQTLDERYLFKELESSMPFPTHGVCDKGVLKSVTAIQRSFEIENGDTIVIPEVQDVELKSQFVQTYNQNGLPLERKDVWTGRNPTEHIKLKLQYDEYSRLSEKIVRANVGPSFQTIRFFYLNDSKSPGSEVREYVDFRGVERAKDSIVYRYEKDKVYTSGWSYNRQELDKPMKLYHTWVDQLKEDAKNEIPDFGKDTVYINKYKTKAYGLKFKCKTEYSISSFGKQLLRIESRCNKDLLHEMVFTYNDQGLLETILEREINGENSSSDLITTYTYDWY